MSRFKHRHGHHHSIPYSSGSLQHSSRLPSPEGDGHGFIWPSKLSLGLHFGALKTHDRIGNVASNMISDADHCLNFRLLAATV
jgi:hypothetical protein